MGILEYAVGGLALLSGVITAAFGLLCLVAILDDRSVRGRADRDAGLVFGMSAIALGGLLIFAATEIWP